MWFVPLTQAINKLGVKMKLNEVLKDLVTLKLPVTAAAVTATLVGLVKPFGIDLTEQTVTITAALSLLGVLASLVSKYRK